MIAALRRRHKWMWAVLGPGSLAVLGSALWARQPSPTGVVPGSPAPLQAQALFASGPVGQLDGQEVRVHRAEGALLLSRDAPLRRPDVVVYSVEDAALDRLPEGAVPLGVWDGDRTARVPAPPSGRHLLFYSHGHSAVLGGVDLGSAP